MTAIQIRAMADAVHLLAVERLALLQNDKFLKRHANDQPSIGRKTEDCHLALDAARVLRAWAEKKEQANV